MDEKKKRRSGDGNWAGVEIIRRPKGAAAPRPTKKRKATKKKTTKVPKKNRGPAPADGRSAPARPSRSPVNSASPRTPQPAQPSHGTQFEGSGAGERLDLVIGLDFGTASTKVIVRAPYFLEGKAYAVPFAGSTDPQNPYLLPSRVVRGPDGGFGLGGETGSDDVLPNVKGMLMGTVEAPVGLAAIELPTRFLALVLREVRRWFLGTRRRALGQNSVIWSLNLGIPAAQHARDEQYALFHHAARAAWHASLGSRAIDERVVRRALHATEDASAELVDCESVEVVPEVAAQAVGYARSDLIREGLHFIVDVGATTLDVCGFVLHKRGAEHRYSVLSADVTRHGTSYLQRLRFSALRDLADRADPLVPVPESFLDWLPEYALAHRVLDGIDAQFAKHAGG